MLKNWPRKLLTHKCNLKYIPKNSGNGIYFLMNRDVLIYIGESENVYSRIDVHQKNNVEFTHSYFLPWDDQKTRKENERILINHYKPLLNIMDNPDNAHLLGINLMKCRARQPKNKLFELLSRATMDSIQKVVSTLSPIEEDVIKSRYGIGRDIITQRELGETHGISNERIRQIQTKAERKLMHPTRRKHLQ